jgi:D-hydantoinase
MLLTESGVGSFDTIVRGGTVVTASDTVRCDVGIAGGRIVALAEHLEGAPEIIDANGLLVLPGGIDSHCHVDQRSFAGGYSADTWESGTRSALAGGTTTIIPFAAQFKGKSLRETVDAYRALAEGQAYSDYAIHMIVSDPTPKVIDEELPGLVADGYSSVKIYLTYEALKLSDFQALDLLAAARREGAITMVHAENHDVIAWLTQRLEEAGHILPHFHRVAHADIAESEAALRAVTLAEVADAPILIVHVSIKDAIDTIRHARSRGLRVYSETCPQYLFLTEDDLIASGWEGAKCMCSPPPRSAANQEVVWSGLVDGTFDVFSSDHAAFRFDGETGKFVGGFNEETARFRNIANGIPGLELRLPLLFSEGVMKGRISLNRFVDLAATQASKIYGLYPRKGTIAVGADADLVLWDKALTRTVGLSMLHDNSDFTPYAGRTLTGWPVRSLVRGRTVFLDGEVCGERGFGRFLKCDRPAPAQPAGRPIHGFEPATGVFRGW